MSRDLEGYRQDRMSQDSGLLHCFLGWMSEYSLTICRQRLTLKAHVIQHSLHSFHLVDASVSGSDPGTSCHGSQLIGLCRLAVSWWRTVWEPTFSASEGRLRRHSAPEGEGKPGRISLPSAVPLPSQKCVPYALQIESWSWELVVVNRLYVFRTMRLEEGRDVEEVMPVRWRALSH